MLFIIAAQPYSQTHGGYDTQRRAKKKPSRSSDCSSRTLNAGETGHVATPNVALVRSLFSGIASYRAFIASHRKSDAGPRIALLASDSSIQCISIASAKRCDAMHHNLVASVCIAFRYDADAMHRFFDAMHRFFDAIPIHGYLSHHIASFHRWTIRYNVTPPGHVIWHLYISIK
ncbi:hypothetical protein PGT21_034115 [Puccinia graminis f. sp. tritici]|uniref:Uncharacterized protein n=1 Tax=Puccinia graminis f. sp. tritici TaxID=56615 RepID=A0A5B0LR33_PUCGR|nr:hypothetical protein PGT21_034115 [Puccinia graminis f. sp. tritici]